MSADETLRMQIKESAHNVAEKVLKTIDEASTANEHVEVQLEGELPAVLSVMEPEEVDETIAATLRKYAEDEDRFLERFTDAQCARDELLKALEDVTDQDDIMTKVHLTRTYYESVLGMIDDLANIAEMVPELLLQYFEYYETHETEYPEETATE